MKPVVAIVGRPNVGKSTLFNRIIQKRLAIEESESGITRDRLYADSEWLGRPFMIVDTGGIDLDDQDVMTPHIRRQAELAVAEAAVILFVVDGRTGLTSADEDVAAILRRSEKPVILVVNKTDNLDQEKNMFDFYRLGFPETIAVSAVHGLGIGDLLDRMVDLFEEEKADEVSDDEIMRVAFIGRPNVGKSSLINYLLGEERLIVSDIPGTTRDSIDTRIRHDDQELILIDTAGMRRRSRVEKPVERYSVMRALKSVDQADVVLLVLDATQSIAEQDQRIAGYAHDAGKAMIIVMNKWDLVEKDGKTMDRFRRRVREELSFVDYAPILFISAKTGQRVTQILDTIQQVTHQYFLRLSTAVINEVLREAVSINPPSAYKGRRLKIYYGTQTGVRPPTFVFFVNDPDLMHFSYKRFLENKIRESFGFEGTPLKILLRKRESQS